MHADTVRIVSPDWILDSIDMGMRLSEKDYHPSVFRSSRCEESSQAQLSCDEIQEEATSCSAAVAVANTSRGCNGELPLQADPLASGVSATTARAATARPHKGRVSAASVSVTATTGASASSHSAPRLGSGESNGAGEGEGEREGRRKISGENAVGLAGPVGADVLGQTFASREKQRRCGADGTRNSTPDTFALTDTGTSSARKRSQSTVPTSPDAPISSPSHNKMAGLSSSSSNTSKQPLTREGGSASLASRLLEGVTLCFSDYQECVDQDTLSKWKEVGPVCGVYVCNCMHPHCTSLLYRYVPCTYYVVSRICTCTCTYMSCRM